MLTATPNPLSPLSDGIARANVDARRPHDSLRLMIAMYFWLIFFEGVLRKWVFPGMSDLLFIARDPVLLVIYIIALARGQFPLRLAVVTAGGLAVMSLVFSVFVDVPIEVVLFGLRTNYLHLPLVFIMGSVLDREDAVRFCRWTLWLAVPILVLMILQFQAGTGARVNAGVGGAADSQLTGAMGRVRPSGPFSFTTGIVFYWGWVTAIVCHGWTRPRTYPTYLLIAASVATLVAIPVSISRATLMNVLMPLGFVGLLLAKPTHWNQLGRTVLPIMLLGGVFWLLRDSIFVETFNSRWNEAATFGGGNLTDNVFGRLWREYSAPFRLVFEVPLTGEGIGLGTMAGSRFIVGARGFLLEESEMGRVMMELGPVLGLAFIGWRVWLATTVMRHSLTSFRHDGDVLAWALGGAVFLSVINSQWGQATMLGFSVFVAGLALAALNAPAHDDEPSEDLSEHP